MNRFAFILRRLPVLAPWCALAVMMGFSQVMPVRVDIDDDAAQRKADVAAAIEAVPFFVGEWIGRDEPVPPEAQKLLRPNAIFSRGYQQPGGRRAHVVFVHCSDVRDMIGHYPPVCYPSSGWVAEAAADPVDDTLEVDGHEFPVRLYRFRRMRERGGEDQIRIFSAFVLPDGTVTRDISDVHRQAERLAVAVQGVAQMQVITAAGVSRAQAEADAAELLAGMEDLLHALGIGEGTES